MDNRMTYGNLFPIPAGLRGMDQRTEDERINEFAVTALLAWLREKTASTYRVMRKPDEIIRDKRAPIGKSEMRQREPL